MSGTRFAPMRRYTAGASAPTSPVLVDLDGDGRPDVVTANTNGDDVSIFLQTAAGGFSIPRNYESGVGPQATAVGDLNGDHKPDVVTVHMDGAVAVHLGRGDGSLDPARRFESRRSMAGLVLGDFDRDGRLDVASATPGLSAVSIFLGNGDGTLKEPTYVSAGEAPIRLAAAHLDGDGKLDLATASGGTNDITLLFGGGDGTFPRRRKYPTSACPEALALADLDLDGHVDVVVLTKASWRGEALNVYLNRGDGTLDEGALFPIDKDPWQEFSLVIADANGDGKPDVLMADSNGAVRVLLGAGDGSFKGALSSPAPPSRIGLAVGDVTGHGKIDALMTGGTPNLAVLAGRGDGSFLAATTYGGDRSPQSLVTADFNRDGVIDVAAWNYRAVTIWLGRGGRELGDPIVTDIPITFVDSGNGTTAPVTADFERTGTPSIAAARGKELLIAFGLGDGRFGRAAMFELTGVATQLAVADFNLDGRPDVVASISRDEDVVFEVLLGQAGGKLDAPIPTLDPRGVNASAFASAIGIGDFNGDGKPDAVVAVPTYPKWSGALVFLGNGDGTFNPGARYEDVGSAFLAVADVNRDGKLDVLTRDTKQRLAVLLGNGDGTFAVPLFLELEDAAIHRIGDVNGDGVPDLVTQGTSFSRYGALAVWLGAGNGRFARDGEYFGGAYLADVIVGNLVPGGWGDLLVADLWRSSLGVLRNVSERR